MTDQEQILQLSLTIQTMREVLNDAEKEWLEIVACEKLADNIVKEREAHGTLMGIRIGIQALSTPPTSGELLLKEIEGVLEEIGDESNHSYRRSGSLMCSCCEIDLSESEPHKPSCMVIKAENLLSQLTPPQTK